MAHTCNPSYSGGRNHRIEVQSQPQENRDPISKTTPQQKGLAEWLKW
jgi:hypothetical protein